MENLFEDNVFGADKSLKFVGERAVYAVVGFLDLDYVRLFSEDTFYDSFVEFLD